MRHLSERSPSESYFWPVVWALSLHLLMFVLLFVSFQFTPELPPARPIIQTTLYQLKSQSRATTQTPQKIAGEAKKTAAPSNQVEQLETKKVEQQKQAAAAKAAEQKKVAEQKKAEATKKAAEQKKQAEIAKKKSEQEKKKAAEEAKKKAAAEEAKKKAAAEAAKKKAAQEASRKAAEDKKAQALAELLAENTEYQQALADTVGDQVAGNLDDLLIKLVSEQWQRPPSARNGMSVEVLIEMLPDGTISNASVTRSSGDLPFDNSAVAAVRNVGRIQEMQQLDRATFDAMYRKRRVIFKPEDLSL
ncbi:cell envelope integrity protein TolA [Pseudomonas sp. N040]|uniref:cell envelope integrity protein TolA n=1 Tax=Pseudomonas sp. N040 TaxID=2785325 RepID=UPI0018A2BF36|nr:cell envelope integrity protein TolA [Pseudomonas sp. N040]MBF7729355.1 cell envelope integrity protein TolA [Pseudomonas sp. N040]MBW7012995.1 cell envelope integrity protein TolA [Pseudomonas sp. N040]